MLEDHTGEEQSPEERAPLLSKQEQDVEAAIEPELDSKASDVKSDADSITVSSDEESGSIKVAILASWVVNIFLLAVKLGLFIVTHSKSVLAALADSVVDLLSQAVIEYAERNKGIHHEEYPVGRSRLEALAVLACGAIMMFANIEIIQYSVVDLVQGVNGDIPTFNTNWYIYGLLGVGIVLKLVLWTYCVQVQKATASDSVKALAEDHLNDVMSNSVAVVCLSIAAEQKSDPNLWWFDALGAVLISGVIIYRWYEEGSEQVEKIVGRSAPPEFISDVEKLAVAYDKRVEVDCTRAYHCGARFHVEMEIVLPGELPLKETHDIALIIQHKIEKKQEVERAFVHVDYKIRDGLEHKVERELVTGSKNLTKQTPPGAEALVNPETCAAAPHLEGSDHGVIQDYA